MHHYIVCVYFTQNFDEVKTDIFVYITEKNILLTNSKF